MDAYKSHVISFLEKAGIAIGGPNDFDIHVNDDRFYEMFFKDRTVGAGEAYTEGFWDVKDLKLLAEKIFLSGKLDHQYGFLNNLIYQLNKAQGKLKALFDIKKTYDHNIELYRAMLDKRLLYTCAYWNNIDYSVANLDLAQEQKLELVCQKLGLHQQPKGQSILDYGCGFAGFAKYAHEKYGAKVVGITISKLQYKVAKEICKGLPIEIRFQDYRDIPKGELYDHLVALGIIEHITVKNAREFILNAKSHLKNEKYQDNRFVLHGMFTNGTEHRIDPWMEKYIFPGAEIFTFKHLFDMIHGVFYCQDFHPFGPDYSLTADAWYQRLEMNYGNLLPSEQNNEFMRTFEFYLKTASASFLTQRNNLMQMVLTHGPVINGLEPVREIFPKKKIIV